MPTGGTSGYTTFSVSDGACTWNYQCGGLGANTNPCQNPTNLFQYPGATGFPTGYKAVTFATSSGNFSYTEPGPAGSPAAAQTYVQGAFPIVYRDGPMFNIPVGALSRSVLNGAVTVNTS